MIEQHKPQQQCFLRQLVYFITITIIIIIYLFIRKIAQPSSNIDDLLDNDSSINVELPSNEEIESLLETNIEPGHEPEPEEW